MSLIRLQFSFLALYLAAALTAACGGQESASLSPLGPSANSGATISGRVNITATPTPSRSLATAETSSFSTLESRGITITVVGTGVSTTADSQGQFTLTNVPAGTVQLNFSGAGSNATVTIADVGPNDKVQITVSVNGNHGHVDSEHHSNPGHNGEFVGRIGSIDAGAKTFLVSGTTVKVVDSTTIRHGSKTLHFADLKVGDHVQVRGTKDGATITATEIKVETDADNDDDEDEAGELEGAVSALGGTCPSITFTVQNTKVSTNNATAFADGTCSTVQNGTKVEVKGNKQNDGSVLATRVEID